MPISCLTRRKPCSGKLHVRDSLEFTQSKIEEIVTIKSALQEKKKKEVKKKVVQLENVFACYPSVEL